MIDMSTQQDGRAAVASLTLIGVFGTLITAVATHTPLDGTLVAILVSPLATVVGFFFGARGGDQAIEASHNAVQAVTDTAHTAMVGAGAAQNTAPPPAAGPTNAEG